MGKKTARNSKQKMEKEDVKKKKEMVEVEDEADDEGEETERVTNSEESESEDEKSPSKRKNEDLEPDNEYEVERIVDDRMVRGITQFRVHWKGFPSSQDTWEDSNNLDCEDLLSAYLKNKDKQAKLSSDDENVDEEEEEEGDNIKDKKTPNKKGKKRPTKRSSSSGKKPRTEIKPDENGEFEISRILDMHVAKNGKHEYLVLWKGFPFSESSWEPEENVKETAAYDRFLKKLQEVKSITQKELRVSRRPTDRFTISTQSASRRLSRRFENKQRAKYFETE